jgi:hypothetical protein
MRKRKYAYWMLLGMLGGNVLFAVPALAEKTCPWLQKILAAKDDEFRAFKGDELGGYDDGITFKGTLELNVTGKAKEQGCSLVVRRHVDDANGEELPPDYRCLISWEATFAEAAADYESIAKKVRDCLPEVAFDDARKGNVSDYSEVWTFSGESNGAKIVMDLADWGAMTEIMSGRTPSGKPGVGVQIMVLNKSPLRAGLDIEIPVMK